MVPRVTEARKLKQKVVNDRIKESDRERIRDEGDLISQNKLDTFKEMKMISTLTYYIIIRLEED